MSLREYFASGQNIEAVGVIPNHVVKLLHEYKGAPYRFTTYPIHTKAGRIYSTPVKSYSDMLVIAAMLDDKVPLEDIKAFLAL